MSEVQREVAPQEPGHRYSPRKVAPRYMEVRTFARHATTTPPESKQIEPLFKQPEPAANRKIDVTPSAILTPSVSKSTRSAETTTSKTRGHAKPALPRLNRSTVLRRQIVDKAAQYQKQSQDQRKRLIFAFTLGGAVATLLVGGVFIFYSTNQSKRQVLSATTSTEVDAASAHRNAATAAETTVSQPDIDAYHVTATQPRVMRIPTLGVQARIYPVRQDLNGDVLPTDNIFDTGWLATGTMPGSNGAAIIDGYVAGASKPGVFVGLSTLSVGDVVQIEKGDGTVLNFKVVRSQQYPANAVDMKAVATPAIAGHPGLNLLTNTGRFDVRSNQFEPRLVVFTVLQ